MIRGPEFEDARTEAVNAIVMRTDWRPVLGFGPRDAGTLPERLMGSIALEQAVEQHNAAVAESQKASTRAA